MCYWWNNYHVYLTSAKETSHFNKRLNTKRSENICKYGRLSEQAVHFTARWILWCVWVKSHDRLSKKLQWENQKCIHNFGIEMSCRAGNLTVDKIYERINIFWEWDINENGWGSCPVVRFSASGVGSWWFQYQRGRNSHIYVFGQLTGRANCRRDKMCAQRTYPMGRKCASQWSSTNVRILWADLLGMTPNVQEFLDGYL